MGPTVAPHAAPGTYNLVQASQQAMVTSGGGRDSGYGGMRCGGGFDLDPSSASRASRFGAFRPTFDKFSRKGNQPN